MMAVCRVGGVKRTLSRRIEIIRSRSLFSCLLLSLLGLDFGFGFGFGFFFFLKIMIQRIRVSSIQQRHKDKP